MQRCPYIEYTNRKTKQKSKRNFYRYNIELLNSQFFFICVLFLTFIDQSSPKNEQYAHEKKKHTQKSCCIETIWLKYFLLLL